jgi:hypothetical protein
MSFKNKFTYVLLLLSVLSAIMALITSNFIFKSGTAGIGIIILILLHFRKVKPSKATWLIVGAFFVFYCWGLVLVEYGWRFDDV